MALIKCSECGNDVSDKAPACPNCGNPINGSAVQIVNPSGQTFKVEPELTSRKWKQVKLIAWGGIFLGFIFIGASGGTDFNNPAFSGGSILLFFSIIALIVGHIGAWYADKRTR
jgi:uncharacterized membrane protein YvbJ